MSEVDVMVCGNERPTFEHAECAAKNLITYFTGGNGVDAGCAYDCGTTILMYAGKFIPHDHNPVGASNASRKAVKTQAVAELEKMVSMRAKATRTEIRWSIIIEAIVNEIINWWLNRR